MNYKRIYDQLIGRARYEVRKKNQGVYYERHHIVPVFMFKSSKRTRMITGHLCGDPDRSDNVVLLTPREHLVAHALLAKMLVGTPYYHQAAGALSFFFTKVIDRHPRQQAFNCSASRKYEWCRMLGLEGISNARKGKIPVKDALTGEVIGSVSTNHAKVLSGEWVHTSKGRKQPAEERLKHGDTSGSRNHNFKEMTQIQEQRLFKLVHQSIIDARYVVAQELERLMKIEFTEFKRISRMWIINRYGSIGEFVATYNASTGSDFIYDPYYRSPSRLKAVAERNRQYRWVTDGIQNKRLLVSELSEFLQANLSFKLGRT